MTATDTATLDPQTHCFREDGCVTHGAAVSEGRCCCCDRPAGVHTGCDCD